MGTREHHIVRVQVYLPIVIVQRVRELAESRGVGLSTIFRMLVMSALDPDRRP